MSKFSNAGRTGGSTALDRLAAKAQAQLPVEPRPQEEVVAPTAFPATAFDPSVNLAATEELPSGPQPLDAQQAFEATLAEQERQAVPDLRARFRDPMQPLVVQQGSPSDIDGGIFDRANRMAESVQAGNLIPPVDLRNVGTDAGPFKAAIAGESGPAIADIIGAEKEGSIQAGINRVGAVDYSNPRAPVVDPDFIKAGSLVTENMLMHFAGGAKQEIEADLDDDPVLEAIDAPPPMRTDGKIRQIAKQQGNAAIGQQIAQEYQRMKGVEVPNRIPTKEAETLGDAFKMMWVNQNPQLANVIRDPKTNQKYIQLTPAGEAVLTKGEQTRKRLFPTRRVRPSKTPLHTGKLPGDTGQNVAKSVQGPIGKQKFGKVLEDAMRNLGQVPNVVDAQRLRVLYSTALPVLKTSNINSVSARINNIGSNKLSEYEVRARARIEKDRKLKVLPQEQKDRMAASDAEAEMQKAQFKLAQEIQAIAMERKGANYLSYAIQAFQGRITPQQTLFNPTTSKAVRFVTRNAVPAPAKPGSRVDYNLRQMYAMMLVPGADEVLPHVREQKFEAYKGTIEAYGDRLEQALQMTEAEAEAISQAIEKGIPMTDPSFPRIKPLALDPQADAELIAKIKSKGEDGMHYIDGLIDAAKYIKANREGRTYHSYFNAYIDGKTNGVASNGIQMGITETARQTGVIRYSEDDYLDEPGDIRAVLKDTLVEMVDTSGLPGTEEYAVEAATVAKAIFSHRDLNKKTIMTFSYGKEIKTFVYDLHETAMMLKADPSLIKDEQLRADFEAAVPVVERFHPEAKSFGELFMQLYEPALESVMSPEALESRNVMRSASIMFAATNQLMRMTGPTGMDLHFGRGVQDESQLTSSKYRLRGPDVFKGGQEYTAYHQGEEYTSSAARTYTDPEGDATQVYGEYAYGGSVVGPVQALDAATVGLSLSGKSWQRMKMASGGNPYVHTIYDAFKSDAMSFDVILEEVNTNWLDASMNWSYLEETKKALQEDMATWKADMRKRRPDETITKNEAAYMNFIMEPVISSKGNPYPGHFIKRIGAASEINKRTGSDEAAMKAGWELINRMRKVGYDWQNPPANPTVAQLQTFVDYIENLMKPTQRLDSMITRTNFNKAQLRKEILRHGYKTKSGKVIPLQYYAH